MGHYSPGRILKELSDAFSQAAPNGYSSEKLRTLLRQPHADGHEYRSCSAGFVLNEEHFGGALISPLAFVAFPPSGSRAAVHTS